MLGLIERLRGRQRERLGSYATVVRSVAAGEEVDEDEALATIEQAGRTVEQFHADVELVQRRQAMRAQLDSADDLREQQQALAREREAKLSKLDEKIRNLRSERKQYADETQSELLRTGSAIAAAEKARAELVQTYDGRLDPEGDVQPRLDEVDGELKAIYQDERLRAHGRRPDREGPRAEAARAEKAALSAERDRLTERKLAP